MMDTYVYFGENTIKRISNPFFNDYYTIDFIS
jgi:hypothetical protein